ncbi:Ammonium transporter [Komagataella phaffii CBS 7435]|uniref:Ammonium permease n=2 Tax=Komagataella phaffii TaxID=460519 RepID=C4QYT4_KOMPG|nr:Ammonium permease [Komagataella phaffii GS115]AOA60909.1 GQ67_01594T0 [Komagataella phaffii]CAH2447233.1 Ammonium transporter [Komagataella phaffii CBS 7435]AOA66271.1 GQ68_01610T0 [Komagataella phaffii GS115]CAY68408.1 Ammonium permease [Komagataella phaffii GS115]SCV11927.1 Ammonium transporter [Komagataella phaffii CBS 7435]
MLVFEVFREFDPAVDGSNPKIMANGLFLFTCSSLLIFVVLGIAMFYSGMTQRRSSLSMLGIPLIVTMVTFIVWCVLGYSLTFSNNASTRYIGNFQFAGLRNLERSLLENESAPDNLIPALPHAVFEGLLACVAAALTMPCIAERGRILPMLVFCVVWVILVYCPVAYWEWNSNGWMVDKIDILDYGGGSPVHLVSGFTTLAYSILLGQRDQILIMNKNRYRNSNTGMIVIGTMFLVTGWLGFNAGCSLTLGLASFISVVNTLISSAMASLTWMCVDYYWNRKLSIMGVCSGCITGLVVITPAAGYVNLWSSFIFGFVGGFLVNFATGLKYLIHVDDCLDIFAIHGIGGMIGILLTGLFADKNIAILGFNDIAGGWVNQNYVQLGWEVVGTIVVSLYAFTISFVVLLIINWIPGLRLKVDDEQTLHGGADEWEFGGEFIQDFVEFLRILDPTDYLRNEVEPQLESPAGESYQQEDFQMRDL